MLTFVALIVARWLGWSAPNLGEAEVLKPWDTAEIGPGGYVIGRSADKVLPAEVESLGKWEIDQAPAEGRFPPEPDAIVAVEVARPGERWRRAT